MISCSRKTNRRKLNSFINVETLMAAQNFGNMVKIADIEKLGGIVVGRVDLVGSMGLDRSACDSEKVFAITKDLLTVAKENKMTVVVGGAISADSLPFSETAFGRGDDRSGTKQGKICFSCPDALKDGAEKGIAKAVEFESLWLQNKRSYYKTIAEEDEKRIIMLEARHKQSQG